MTEDDLPNKIVLLEYASFKLFYNHRIFSLTSSNESELETTSDEITTSSISRTIKNRKDQRKEEVRMKRKMKAEMISKKNNQRKEEYQSKKIKAEALKTHANAMINKN